MGLYPLSDTVHLVESNLCSRNNCSLLVIEWLPIYLFVYRYYCQMFQWKYSINYINKVVILYCVVCRMMQKELCLFQRNLVGGW